MIEPQSRQLELQDVELSADLRLPLHADGLVIFVHGSGSGRLSPRNRFVAQLLARRGLGSLLFDLLTEPEQRLDNLTGELRFDIDLLAGRLVEVIDWVGRDADLRSPTVHRASGRRVRRSDRTAPGHPANLHRGCRMITGTGGERPCGFRRDRRASRSPGIWPGRAWAHCWIRQPRKCGGKHSCARP